MINDTYKIKLYYKNGNLCFEGKVMLSENEEDIIFGAVYHRNGNLYYKGNFLDGSPSDFECTLHYEIGNIRYQGPIEDGKVPKPLTCSKNFKVHVGKFCVKKFSSSKALYRCFGGFISKI